MKLYLITCCCLLVVGLVISCRHAEPEPDFFADGVPRLKSVSFSGIPQENISIDQKSKIITVQMPSIILDRIAVSMELTDKAEWIEKGKYYIVPNAFGCESCFQIILKDLSGQFDYTVYTIKTIANAPLQVALLSQPITYSISIGDDSERQDIDIPMVNLYGNALPKEVHLTYDNTGEEVIIKRVSSFVRKDGAYYSSKPNKLAIHLYDQKL